MNERDALALVQRLLAGALGQPAKSTIYIRDLAAQNGELRATMRAALTVIEQADAQASVERAFPKVAEFLAEERERGDEGE
ncbi:hypothetical protein [Streptomyces sp. LUP47B]|uniref:hypothetical protein n=1 Tax=Streptomyces sp. LUP47B TaxID=1890286 RepID=UPI000851B486|nr:hypothetical protein [Streptomyces sp. LUP47B]